MLKAQKYDAQKNAHSAEKPIFYVQQMFSKTNIFFEEKGFDETAPNDKAEWGEGRKRARPKNEIAECFFPTRQKKDKAEKRLRRIFKIGS